MVFIFRFSCPYTSQHNRKAERFNRTIGNMIRTLLMQGSMSPSFWVEALLTTSHILNLLPSSLLNYTTPYETLYHKQPSYNHLRVFGCAYYPNLLSQAPHKLFPRSTLCVFLGYPQHHKGYRCYDLHSRKVIMSCHVVFDENNFLLAHSSSSFSSSGLSLTPLHTNLQDFIPSVIRDRPSSCITLPSKDSGTTAASPHVYPSTNDQPTTSPSFSTHVPNPNPTVLLVSQTTNAQFSS